ncbi:MAG: mandelate racemase [Alphaproteobacteria bacterium]|nr:mandelate racemase [Alphaproteobacteria bacterium]
MSDAPRLTVLEVRLYERPVRLRLPFRFGMITLREAPQAFARVLVQGHDGREAWGAAAEMLVPKWFDKSPDLSNEENIAHLRAAAHKAAGLYREAGAATSWELSSACYVDQVAQCAHMGMNSLVAGFGTALLDRAVLDALCRLQGSSVFEAVRANLPGLVWDDLDMTPFVADRPVPESIAVRHTVGMVDPLDDADRSAETDIHDGLPVTLEDAIAAYGCRHFKITVSDDVDAALARLERIAAILDRSPEPYAVTIDGGEQFTDIAGVAALWAAIAGSPKLERLRRSCEFLEQPLHRDVTFDQEIAAAGVDCPVIIDEADGAFDAFPRARDLGYRGVSYKGCKGIYKGLINAARCAAWNAELSEERYFMTAEDLTTQAGICVQQDTAMAALIGVAHVQRNGHHYANGMQGVPETEAVAFLDAHPDLYHRADGVVRLTVEDGKIALGSLARPGFARAAEPAWETMEAMAS